MAPGLGVAGLSFLGVSIPDWIMILTLLHISLAVLWKLWSVGKGIYKHYNMRIDR